MRTLVSFRLAPRRARLLRRVLLPCALCFAMLSAADPASASAFSEFVDPHPAPGNQFGATVVP